MPDVYARHLLFKWLAYFLELFFGIDGLAFSLIILQFGCAADHTHLLNETISL